MNIINKIIYAIKNILKKEKVKMLDIPKQEVEQKREDFSNTLKVQIIEKKKIETLICEGDGLGIQNIISD